MAATVEIEKQPAVTSSHSRGNLLCEHEHDEEKSLATATAYSASIAKYGLLVDGSGLVTWCPSSPLHPRNWSLARKIYDTGLIIFIDAFQTVISTGAASAGDIAKDELGISKSFEIVIFLSLYLIAQCLGGIVFPSYSESFGRKWLYTIGTLLYGLFCVLVAAWPTIPGIIVGRFCSGLLSAIPLCIASGSIEDLWDIHARVWIFFAGCTIGNMGLCFGPILSPYIIDKYGWHCVFYISGIVCGITTVLFSFMRESRPSLILARVVYTLNAQSTKSGGSHDTTSISLPLTTSSPDHMPDLRTFLHTSVLRPVHLFFTEPIIFLVSVLIAVTSALIYLFTEVMPDIFDSYTSPSLSRTQKMVPWLAIAFGLLLSGFMRMWDHRRLRDLASSTIKPEDKLVGFALATPCLAIGLWVFAWTVPPFGTEVSWGIPCASLVLVGWAVNEYDIVLAGYLTDTYKAYAGSAFGAMNMLRSILSAVFPLFAPSMFDGLGNNLAGTTLACVATAFVAVPVVFMKYGGRIRESSRFAVWTTTITSRDE